MANEVSNATLVSNGGRISKVLSPFVHTLLYDPVGLRSLMTFRPEGVMGSATANVTKLTRGSAAAAASSETSGGASNTALTTANYDLTVARYLLKFQATDLFALTGGPIDVDTIMSILEEAVELTYTDLLTALFANIAGNVGTSGARLTVDDIFDALYYLNMQNNGAAAVAVLAPRQINHLRESLRGETGAMQWRTDVSGMIGAGVGGVGFQGRLLDASFYQSDSVALANANADRQGCMFTQGAFAYRFGSVAGILNTMINPADVLMATPEMFIERVRDGANGMSSPYLNFYPAVAEQEDLRGVKITTSASA